MERLVDNYRSYEGSISSLHQVSVQLQGALGRSRSDGLKSATTTSDMQHADWLGIQSHIAASFNLG